MTKEEMIKKIRCDFPMAYDDMDDETLFSSVSKNQPKWIERMGKEEKKIDTDPMQIRDGWELKAAEAEAAIASADMIK